MKNIYKIFFIFFVFTFEAKSKMLVLEDLRNPGNTIGGQEWYFVTDGVMGGVSEGSAKLDKVEKTKCHRMTGNVSTENNGGFIQIRTLLKPKININDYEGIFAYVYGNNKNYSFHIRTGNLLPGNIIPISFYQLIIGQKSKLHFQNSKNLFYQPKDLSNQK